MAERIELPPTLQGDEKSQLQQLWSYLYQMSESLNNNLQAIGSNDLTDNDRKIMQKIIQDTGETAPQFTEMETLKSLIIKTADFVQTRLQEYRLNLLGESVASGQFGRYVRHTGLDVEVTPEGITQNYSFEEVVQGLKEFSVNAKNYIKTGLLRTVSSIPVYGVAIGKDVVTFAEDGTETYNDGNKVAELTADELSFWQNSTKIASYKGNRISFFYNGSEAFYIQNGKVYCVNDLELASGKKLIINTDNFKIDNNGKVTINGDGTFSGDLSAAGGTFKGNLQAAGGTFAGDLSAAGGTFKGSLQAASGTFTGDLSAAGGSFTGYVGIKKPIENSGGIVIGQFITEVGEKRENPVYGDDPDNVRMQFAMIQAPQQQEGNWWSYGGVRFWLDEMIELPQKTSFFDYCNKMDTWNAYAAQPMVMAGLYPDPGEYLPNLGYIGTMALGSDTKPWRCGVIKYLSSTKIKTYSITATEYNNASSREVKQNIADLPENGEAIDQLRPVCYEYKAEPGRRRFGLIHEEAAEVLPEICTGIGEKEPEKRGINYVELVPLLLKEIQSLRARVAQLESRMGGK